MSALPVLIMRALVVAVFTVIVIIILALVMTAILAFGHYANEPIGDGEETP